MIVPTWTFTATAEVVRYLGARPVVVDVDRATLNLTADGLEAALTDRTRAVMPVHFGGLPCDMDCAPRSPASADSRWSRTRPTRSPLTDGAARDRHVGDSRRPSSASTPPRPSPPARAAWSSPPTPELADRIRIMRLHGISRDAWKRYTAEGVLVLRRRRARLQVQHDRHRGRDRASCSSRRAESHARPARGASPRGTRRGFAELPSWSSRQAPRDRGRRTPGTSTSSGCDLDAAIDRDAVHRGAGERGNRDQRALHPAPPAPLLPRQRRRYAPQDLPVAAREYERVVSLPAFSSMADPQVERVIETVAAVLR